MNILIGQDVEGAHNRLAVRKSSLKGMPRAELGWIVVGRIPAEILRGPSEKIPLTCRAVEVLPCEERLITLVQNFTLLSLCCDASIEAFGAVCYIRMESESEIDVNFLFAKSRVAPIKGLSIPRLEKQAAVLAFRIASTI